MPCRFFADCVPFVHDQTNNLYNAQIIYNFISLQEHVDNTHLFIKKIIFSKVFDRRTVFPIYFDIKSSPSPNSHSLDQDQGLNNIPGGHHTPTHKSNSSPTQLLTHLYDKTFNYLPWPSMTISESLIFYENSQNLSDKDPIYPLISHFPSGSGTYIY